MVTFGCVAWYSDVQLNIKGAGNDAPAPERVMLRLKGVCGPGEEDGTGLTDPAGTCAEPRVPAKVKISSAIMTIAKVAKIRDFLAIMELSKFSCA